MRLEKVLAMQVAARLTAAVVGNLPDNLPVDQSIADPALQGANVVAWETFRIFYHAVSRAVDDETSWPSPKNGLDLRSLAGPLLNLVPAEWAQALSKFLGAKTELK